DARGGESAEREERLDQPAPVDPLPRERRAESLEPRVVASFARGGPPDQRARDDAEEGEGGEVHRPIQPDAPRRRGARIREDVRGRESRWRVTMWGSGPRAVRCCSPGCSR